ncbi:MAG TPA: hypothetical protein VMF58_09840 [Rhizomicrobium sp.]|nr:hypothetical protein [Rhizomicrobium sp.]
MLADSHAAALKHGWSLIEKDFPGTEFTFFPGTIKSEWSSLRAIDGKLVPQSPVLREHFARCVHRKSEIEDEYDAYLICGITLSIAITLKTWLGLEDKDWATHRAIVAARIGAGNAAHVLAVLREITTKPVLLLAAPFQPRAFCLFSPSLDAETAATIRTIFHEECERLAARHGAKFFAQPRETWAANGVTTKMRYANKQPVNGREDRHHCTAEFGAIVLRAVLEQGFAAD